MGKQRHYSPFLHSIMKQKIALAGLVNDKNLGDLVIFDSTKFLLSQASNSETYGVDISKAYRRLPFASRLFLKFLSFISSEEKIARLRSLLSEKFILRELDETNTTMIVFVGGGLVKYKYQFFWFYIYTLIKVAEKCHIPVFFNGIGVEGYDETDYRCRFLKEALNSEAVRFISVRDDYHTLKSNYLIRKEIHTMAVADPAVFSGKAYGIEKQESRVIGIGLIRSKIFPDNGIAVTKSDLVDLYVGIAKQLLSRHVEFQFFTNGLDSDRELFEEITKRLGSTDASLLVPHSARHLVEIIASFRGVIASRLHANIIAYSLDIPSVGLVWNDKLTFWGEQIGYPERFITFENFDAEAIVGLLMKSMELGYERDNRERFMQTQLISIDQILKDRECEKQ